MFIAPIDSGSTGTTYDDESDGGGFTVDTDDADSSAGGTTSPPDFSDDASFGGSGDDHVVADTDGTPLVSDTQAGGDWLADQLAGESSTDDGNEGGGYVDATGAVEDLESGADPEVVEEDLRNQIAGDSTETETGPEETAPTDTESGSDGLPFDLSGDGLKLALAVAVALALGGSA
ncbi:hypothetical protein ACFQJC_14480 [Haloferax namakaokahaiae]|uniref:PGF-CTERM sorting domain-containing protein n=1 Tax=Haloferax namakaokahaiae TaxID=1748331 RepID=A0ABD5ZHI0_9EURY